MHKQKRRKICFIAHVVILILGAIFLLIRYGVSKNIFDEFVKGNLCFEKICFTVETANTSQEKEKGLMFRTSLEKNRGMIFTYDQPGRYVFWMKNTLIPLDMIRMNNKNKIVHIQDMAQPCTADPCPTFNPGVDANTILEINGGLAKKLGIKIGDVMNYDSK